MVATIEPAVQQQQQTVWQIDPAHTLVEFAVKHMMFTTVKGRFGGVSGQIHTEGDDLTRGSVEVQIDANSIDTGDAQRDAHLRSGDFIESEAYPTIIFKSKRVEPAGGEKFRLVGDLTIKGVTRAVVLDAYYNGRAISPWGTEVASYSATTQIDRKDYGITTNVVLEAGGVLVGESVKITLEVEAIKQN